MLAINTTEPRTVAWCAFQAVEHDSSLSSTVVALRIERSATRLSDAFGRPALDYHPRNISRAPRSRTENLVLPRHACSHLHLRPMYSMLLLVTRVGVEPNLVGLKNR